MSEGLEELRRRDVHAKALVLVHIWVGVPVRLRELERPELPPREREHVEVVVVRDELQHRARHAEALHVRIREYEERADQVVQVRA